MALSQRQLKDCAEVFKALDTSNTGTLTLDLAEQGLEGLGVFASGLIGLSETYKLNFKEFQQAYIKGLQATRINRKTLADAFKVWDAGNVGHITPKEVAHVMKQDGLPPGITEKQYLEMLQFLDADGDGHITLDELIRAVCPH